MKTALMRMRMAVKSLIPLKTKSASRFSNVDSGYWWIELGGDYHDIIAVAEEIQDDLYKCVFGVWDHLNNVGDHGTEKLE